MMTPPKLLTHDGIPPLPRHLLTDLQLDKLLSENALAILSRPCGAAEIGRRQALFVRLEEAETRAKLAACADALTDTERAHALCRTDEPALTRYCLHVKLLRAYLRACAALADLHDCGELCAAAAAFFACAEMQGRLDALRRDLDRLEALLTPMRRGLLSFSDKHWLTPDHGAVSEWETIAACLQDLGLSAEDKPLSPVRLPPSLSAAICRLHPDTAAEIEAMLARHAAIDFLVPAAYLPALRFFLEIRALTARAAARGIPHILPEIAPAPQYTAEAVYDISLLACDCPQIIPNDAHFTADEPFFFLVGANGGGKTTYLRAMGINLLLFGAGCPVFARSACIYPFPRTDSHFPRDERFTDMGRLEEECRRTEVMLADAAGRPAFLLFNETYSGADEERGFAHLRQTAEKIGRAGHFGLYVTHFHRVADTRFPRLSAEVDPADGNHRTYRIVRSGDSASSYAADILRKYRLDRASLQARRDTRDS